MAGSVQIHWHEGLFLQPHHLQTLQRQVLEGSGIERRLAMSYPYGVVDARLSVDALTNLLVQFDSLRVIMPSGLDVSFPDNADLPALNIERVFNDDSEPFLVYLGVPLWQASRSNTLEVGSGESWQSNRLYKLTEVQRFDENSGDNPMPVLVRRINARLMLEQDDRTDLEVIPLLRVTTAWVKTVVSRAGIHAMHPLA